MKLKKVFVHASLALGATIVLSCIVAGCGKKKQDTRPEVYPAEGNAYMKDPEFKAALATQDKARNTILGEREKLFQEFEALEKRAGSRAAAEKLPEWKALEARAQACGRAFESNRWQTTEIFRERLKRAQEDSARIARGEARPKVKDQVEGGRWEVEQRNGKDSSVQPSISNLQPEEKEISK